MSSIKKEISTEPIQEATVMEQLKNSEVNEENAGVENVAKTTLLLRLHGALQSWGADSEVGIKREVPKNGIVDLLGRALGREYGEDVSDLNNLRFGVRVDHEGQLIKDQYYEVDDISGEKYEECVYYLGDATFLVGLESTDEKFLEGLVDNLQHPSDFICLGKNDCFPAIPLVLGIRHTDLETALTEEKWLAHECYQKKDNNNSVILRLIMDSTIDEMTGIRKDVPVSYGHSQCSWRPVIEKDLEIANLHVLAEQGRRYRRYLPIDYPAETPEKSSKERPAETVERLTKLAEAGNAKDQYNLACFYSKGVNDEYMLGFLRDEKKAVEWFTKAAEQGLAEAQYNLGLFYYFGWNNFKYKDSTEARKWLQKAADQGYQDAETFLELDPHETFPDLS